VPPLSQHAMAQLAAVAGGHLPGGVPFGVASPDPPTPNFWKHPAVSRSPAASVSSRSASTAAVAEAAVAAEAATQQQQQQQQGEGVGLVTPERGRKQQGEGADGEVEEDVGSSPGGLMFLMSPVGQTPAPADRPAAADTAAAATAAAAAAEEQPENKPAAAAAAAEESDAVAAGSSASPGSSVSYGNVVMGPGGSPIAGGAGPTNSWDLHPAFGRSLSGGRAGG
jgi:hypothetical protein